MRKLFLVFIFVLSLGTSYESPATEPSANSKLEVPTTDIFTVPGLGKFYLPYKNDLIQKTLRKGQIWESKNIPVFEAFIRPGMTVIDVGAYIGSHTIKFGELAKPGKVYAFEPQEDIHQILSQNIELNGLGDTVTTYKMALGDRSCNTKMTRHPSEEALRAKTFSNRGAGTVVGCVDDSDEPFAFEMRTLDSFKLDNVGFIKIDVEGAQLLVLMGAEKTIKRNKPLMLVEILGGRGGPDFTHHEATPRSEVFQWLEEHGYTTLHWGGTSDFLAIPLP